MIDKQTKIRISLTVAFLVALSLAAVYSMHIHLSARKASGLQQLQMTASQEKTILLSAMMAGGIKWKKTMAIANVHATYADTPMTANLSAVLAIDTKENELYSSYLESDAQTDLAGLVKTHRADIEASQYLSLDTGTHFVTMVAAIDKKYDIVGYVAMAWLK